MPEGTPLRAAASGRVAIAGWVGGYGNYICIQHSGSLSTCYGHQSRIGVSVGQSVSQGQVIGYSGSTGHCTGPHLHFEVRINGSPVDPLGLPLTSLGMQPELDLGPITLQTFGLMLGLGFVVAGIRGRRGS